MRTLRYLLAWYFFLLCMLTAVPGVGYVWTIPKIGDPLRFKIAIAMEVVIILVAAVFGRAWWVLWHERLSARRWCIAASVTNLIAPVGFSILILRGPKSSDFWQIVATLAVPIAIGVAGIAFAFTDAAKSLPRGLQPHLGRVILDSLLLLHLACIFVSGLIICARELLKHRHIPPAYLVVVVLFGYVSWTLFRSLRRTVHNRRAEMKEIAAL